MKDKRKNEEAGKAGQKKKSSHEPNNKKQAPDHKWQKGERRLTALKTSSPVEDNKQNQRPKTPN